MTKENKELGYGMRFIGGLIIAVGLLTSAPLKADTVFEDAFGSSGIAESLLKLSASNSQQAVPNWLFERPEKSAGLDQDVYDIFGERDKSDYRPPHRRITVRDRAWNMTNLQGAMIDRALSKTGDIVLVLPRR